MVIIFRPAYHQEWPEQRIDEFQKAYNSTRDNFKGEILQYYIGNPWERPTYYQMIDQALDFCDVYFHQGIYPVIVICNTDIGFDQTLKMANNIPDGMMYAISRIDVVQRPRRAGQYEIELQEFFHAHSQDVWIMNSHTALHLDNNNCGIDIQMGILGCENTWAKRVHDLMVDLINPCQSIKCYHYHQSGIRTYNQDSRYSKDQYLFIPPTKLC